MSRQLTDTEKCLLQKAENLWLNYFNKFLLESGTISISEYKRMTELIASRKAKHKGHSYDTIRN